MYVFDYRLGSILYISAEQTMLYMIFIIKISVMGVLYRLRWILMCFYYGRCS
jgi:hypothetical protein